MKFITVVFTLCGGFLISVLASSTYAQNIEESESTVQPTQIIDDVKTPAELRDELEDIETIEIESKKPISFYRRQVEAAELDFYDLYNSIANENKFKMYCRLETRVGSRIKRTACYPQYYLTTYAHLSQEAMLRTPSYDLARGVIRQPPSMKDVEFLIQREQEEALEYVEKLVSENPSLLKQLEVMNKALETYNLQKKQRK